MNGEFNREVFSPIIAFFSMTAVLLFIYFLLQYATKLDKTKRGHQCLLLFLNLLYLLIPFGLCFLLPSDWMFFIATVVIGTFPVGWLLPLIIYWLLPADVRKFYLRRVDAQEKRAYALVAIGILAGCYLVVARKSEYFWILHDSWRRT